MSESAMKQIHEFVSKWPGADFGPAHIVLSDYNLTDSHIRWCIGLCRAALSGNTGDLTKFSDVKFMESVDWYHGQDREEMAATIVLLEHLLTIPEAEREAEADNA